MSLSLRSERTGSVSRPPIPSSALIPVACPVGDPNEPGAFLGRESGLERPRGLPERVEQDHAAERGGLPSHRDQRRALSHPGLPEDRQVATLVRFHRRTDHSSGHRPPERQGRQPADLPFCERDSSASRCSAAHRRARPRRAGVPRKARGTSRHREKRTPFARPERSATSILARIRSHRAPGPGPPEGESDAHARLPEEGERPEPGRGLGPPRAGRAFPRSPDFGRRWELLGPEEVKSLAPCRRTRRNSQRSETPGMTPLIARARPSNAEGPSEGSRNGSGQSRALQPQNSSMAGSGFDRGRRTHAVRP